MPHIPSYTPSGTPTINTDDSYYPENRNAKQCAAPTPEVFMTNNLPDLLEHADAMDATSSLNTEAELRDLMAEAAQGFEKDPMTKDTIWKGYILPEGFVKRAIPALQALIARETQKARQEPAGDAIEVDVLPEVMRFVLSRCKQSDKTLASRILVAEHQIIDWRENGGLVEIWRLKVLASLTKKYNWAVFLLKPENLDKLTLPNKPSNSKER